MEEGCFIDGECSWVSPLIPGDPLYQLLVPHNWHLIVVSVGICSVLTPWLLLSILLSGANPWISTGYDSPREFVVLILLTHGVAGDPSQAQENFKMVGCPLSAGGN